MKYLFSFSPEKQELLLEHATTLIAGSRDGVHVELSRVGGDLVVKVDVPSYELVLELEPNTLTRSDRPD